jgi:hypothetical protein
MFCRIIFSVKSVLSIPPKRRNVQPAPVIASGADVTENIVCTISLPSSAVDDIFSYCSIDLKFKFVLYNR